jgi:hypothetical protein
VMDREKARTTLIVLVLSAEMFFAAQLKREFVKHGKQNESAKKMNLKVQFEIGNDSLECRGSA